MLKGLKATVIALATVSVLLLLYGAKLPQYGDGAIGTIMVYAASLAAYVAALILAAPLAIRALRRRETIAQSAWLCVAIAGPTVAWLIMIWGSTRAG